MNVFKTKSVYAAILAGLGAMSGAGSASAVQLSQDGTGQALIYPYYTVRTAANGDYNTILNVVNTQNVTKVVKVRFLEGKNSREVLDFNLWLSPYDVWAGTIVATASGAKLTSSDESCVSTKGGVTKSVAAGYSFDFSNVAYATGTPNLSNDDGVDVSTLGSLDRTREGYFEIIEMGVVNTAAAVVADGVYPSGTALAAGVKHNSASVPANCAIVPTTITVAGDNALLGTDVNPLILPPTGGLFGGASLINVNNGTDFGYDPVALDDMSSVAMFNIPGDILPNFGNTNTEANIFQYVGGGLTAVVTTTGLNSAAASQMPGWDAVSALLSRDNVLNTYVLDAAVGANTDWVLTFPTKRPYVVPFAADTTTTTPNLRPFDAYTEFNANGSCGAFTVTPYNREEQTVGAAVTEVSPRAAGGGGDSLCWESTVLNFHTTATSAPAPSATVLGSTNGRSVAAPYTSGWANLAFTDARTNINDASVDPILFSGLPVVGFAVNNYLNSTVTIGGLSWSANYGGNFNHKYVRNIYAAATAPLPIPPVGRLGLY